jgi:tetratricopeptide (TPR) repeat protein
MTNPPLNWGYPRTVEGFKHAFTRGQYEQTNPNIDPERLFYQIKDVYVEGAVEEFGLVYLLVGLIPFLAYQRLQKRERAWLVGLTAIWLCLGLLLLMLLNPNTEKQAREQARVFFTASHIVVAIAIGYGVTLLGGVLATQYQRYRAIILYSGAGAAALNLYYLFETFSRTQLPTVRYAAVLGLGLALLFTFAVLLARTRALMPVLLAVFALMPARSIFAQWSDNEQRGHLFGYWFGHDMFTPPFPGPDGKLTYDRKLREELLKKPEGKLIYPEMARETILYGGTDPGRFNPTYMIFCESAMSSRYKPHDPDFDRRDVALITQNALADKTYLDYIRAHYNRSAQVDPYFFSELFRLDKEREQNRTNLIARALLPLDRYFTDLGARIEQRRRADGVYPRKEIITANNDDSARAFKDYIDDAARRLQHDAQFPNEPKQVKPMEGVAFTRDGRVQVSGQVAVMSINALLARVIFDKNPNNEFYIEESFPLEWMYPYLSPFGIIMKINRQPLREITQEIVDRDHAFWSKYSERTIGNWITYDTSIKEICEFVERTYLRHDFTGFKGDPKFVRDDFAQKAFSKLRSAIAWIYGWRVGYECPPEHKPKTEAEQQRLLKEADFALRQSYAMCPFSPEALHKLVTLLLISGRVQDARLIAETSLKFDPGNPAFQSYAKQLTAMSGNESKITQAQTQLAQMSQQFRDNPTNLSLGLQLATAYLQMQRTDDAILILDLINKNPLADVPTLLSLVQSYTQLGQTAQLATTVQRLQTLVGPLQQKFQTNANNIGLAFELIQIYLATRQTNLALEMADGLAARTDENANILFNAANVYRELQNWPKMEAMLLRLVKVIPANPEAWYDLGAVQATIGKNDEAAAALQKAILLSQDRLAKQPGSRDLKAEVAKDPRFALLRELPALKQALN